MSSAAETAAHLPEVGDRVPSVTLPRSGGGGVPLRHLGREATVLLRLHGADCGPCRSYLEGLAEEAHRFENWYARLVAVVPGSVEEAARLGESVEPQPGQEGDSGLLRVVADPDGAGPLAGVEGTGVLVFDRYGEVYSSGNPGGHELPAPDEIEAWFTFLATQCPECGVPDRP